MTLRGLLIFSAAGGLIAVLTALFAFSLYDVLAGDTGSGSARPGAVRDLDFSDISDIGIASDTGIGVGSELEPVVRGQPEGRPVGPPCPPQGPPPGRPGRPSGSPPYGPPCPIYPPVVASATCQVTATRVDPGAEVVFTVTVRDTTGRPISSAPVDFSIVEEENLGSSTIAIASGTSGPDGRASARLATGRLGDSSSPGVVVTEASVLVGDETVSCLGSIIVV